MEVVHETRGPYETRRDGDMSSAAPQALQGVMTGLANDVSDRLAALDIPNKPRRLLERIKRHTFGNAGLQRRKHQDAPGLWCEYDLAEWARDLGWDKANLRRTLQWLIDHRIVIYLTTPASGSGRVGWNINLDEWQGSNHGGTRPGAGAPKGNQNARKHDDQAAIVNLIDSSSEHSQVDCSESIKMTTKINQDDYETGRKSIKMTTAAGLGTGNHAALGHAEESYGVNKREETSPNGDARGASAGRVPASASRSKKPRKMSDEQLATHRIEAEWVSHLVADFEAAWGSPLPTPKAYRQMGHNFYHRKDGRPELADLGECLRVTLLDPFYETQPPTPSQFERAYSAWVKGRDGYRKAMENKRKRIARANEDRPAQAARAAPTPRPQAAREASEVGTGFTRGKTMRELEREQEGR